MNKIYTFSNVFFKLAQMDAGTTITQKDEQTVKESAGLVLASSKIISDWIDSKISPTTVNIKLNELKRYSTAIKDISENLNKKINLYLTDNTKNKSVSQFEQDLNSFVQNYNVITSTYIKEDWVQKYSQTKEGKAFRDIKSAIATIKSFVAKAKTQISTSGSSPDLPDSATS